MSTDATFFRPETEAVIARAIERGFGDDVLIEDQENGFLQSGRKPRGTPFRKWDYLDVELSRVVGAPYELYRLFRGCEQLVVWEEITRNIISFLKEERFAQVRRQSSRGRPHITNLYASEFNCGLVPSEEQLSVFPPDLDARREQQQLAERLFERAGLDVDLVRRHVLVLIRTLGYQVMNIRALQLTPELDVVCERDWSHYLLNVPSVVVEQVKEARAPSNAPNRGLVFKPSAFARKAQTSDSNYPLQHQMLDEIEDLN